MTAGWLTDARVRAGALLAALATAALLATTTVPTTAQAASAVSKAQAANDIEAARILESERFRRLAVELRCLVCQNQSLADSDAPLAQDLRDEVVRLIASGRDDGAIKTFLVDRYGEFVLYRPTLSARNAVLWLGPFLLLLIGAIAWWRLGRSADAAPGAGAGAGAVAIADSDPAGDRGSARALESGPASPRASAPPAVQSATGAITTSDQARQALARVDRLLDDDRPRGTDESAARRPS